MWVTKLQLGQHLHQSSRATCDVCSRPRRPCATHESTCAVQRNPRPPSDSEQHRHCCANGLPANYRPAASDHIPASSVAISERAPPAFATTARIAKPARIESIQRNIRYITPPPQRQQDSDVAIRNFALQPALLSRRNVNRELGLLIGMAL